MVEKYIPKPVPPPPDTKWTSFTDSKEVPKTSYKRIFIQGDEDAAIKAFKRYFGFVPCELILGFAGDYVINTHDSLESATAYSRQCVGTESLKDFIDRPDILVLYVVGGDCGLVMEKIDAK